MKNAKNINCEFSQGRLRIHIRITNHIPSALDIGIRSSSLCKTMPNYKIISMN